MKSWIFILLLLLANCTTTVPLLKRGLNKEERHFYVIQNGYGMSQRIKDGFVAGKPCIGMSQEHVFMLFGTATQHYFAKNDKMKVSKEIWSYLDMSDRKNPVLLLEIIFDSNKEVININGIYADECDTNP